MVDQNLLVLFDGEPELDFVQGEDRELNMLIRDSRTGLPIDLTGAIVGVNLPRQDGGSIKRTTLGPLVLSTEIVIPAHDPGYVQLPDHGLVTGDPVTLVVVTGSLPSPLAPSTSYLVKVIDLDSFYITDLNGNVIPLTSQGSGSFNLVNANDVQIETGDLGKVIFALRSPVTQLVNAAIAQDFQVEFTIAGKIRIAVLKNLLDVDQQPVM